MGQSAKPERQNVGKLANVRFLTFMAFKSQETLRPKRPDSLFVSLHNITINSQVRCHQSSIK
jgi:hypothetical protein